MTRKKKRDHDFAITAYHTLEQVIRNTENGGCSEPKKSRKEYDYKALGHAGGLKGGRARAEKLTPEKRSEIARKAARARWRAKA
jgi:hypothetical protein